MKRKKPIKVRRRWGNLNPVTKVKQSAKIYNRKRAVEFGRHFNSYEP